MALKIYSSADPGASYSVGGAFTNPLLIVGDGKYGTVTQRKLYLRNNSALNYYTNNEITVVDTVDPDYVDGSLDITWKLSPGSTQPSDEEWEAIATGNTITLSNLGSSGSPNTSTYLPFWVRTETPRNIEVQTVLDIQLQIGTSEHLV